MLKFVLVPFLVAAIALAIAYRQSPLRTFNALVPKDSSSLRIAEGLAYGDNPRQRIDIYAPRKMRDGPLPVIVFFYGGSWNSGERQGYAFAGRALAAQGFVVAIPDYRLVPEIRYPSFVEDGAAAVRWIQANIGDYGGDSGKIVLSGHSAGAYIAAMLTYDERWLGSDRNRLRGFAGMAGPYDFLPLDTAASQDAFGHWPTLEETQPVNRAIGGGPPALLLTGDEDTTVKPRNSLALADVLKNAGTDARVKQYADIDHIDVLTALARPLRHRADVLEDIVSFARRVTHGKQVAERMA